MPLDSRVPDVVGISQYGVVYTSKTKKIAEHGGFNSEDRNVPLVISGRSLSVSNVGTIINSDVMTIQIAPTILRLLGLDPYRLAAVEIENTQPLPMTYDNPTPVALSVSNTPTTSPSNIQPYSASSCFAGSETIKMQSGEVKAISEIVIGDLVLAADVYGYTIFSEVVYIPHKANKDRALFKLITTDSGKDVKMTKNHLIVAGICDSTLSLKQASKVSKGDCIITISGQEKVASVVTVESEGLYTIVTNEEYLVVNGIVVSPFAANHMMANMFYNIHRFVYTLIPMLMTSTMLHTINEGLGVLIPFFESSL
jgi:hypothetical protein